MIVGIGTDLVHIPRIARAIKRWGTHFLEHVFTSEEIRICFKTNTPELRFAVRFAAKEACSKALGTGLRQGVTWKDMSVEHEASGKPVLKLSNQALAQAERLGANRYHISLTHEKEYANAIVVLEQIQ